MSNRKALLEESLPLRRRIESDREEGEFRLFCERIGINPSHDAVCLYLTCHLDDDAPSGRSLRRRMARLDLAARMRGQEPWSHGADVKTYLRGMHNEVPLVAGEGLASIPLS